MKELRIVSLGKTGSGKSHTGNTILCATNAFQATISATPRTQECESETTTVNGRTIKYVDTPGIIDTLISQEELKSKLWRSIIECAPGPHTFLIILKVERYTEQEQEVVRKIINTFGEEALKYAVVLFTHGDNLDENQTIEEFVSLSPQLQELVEKCEHRCHVIDNKYWKQQEDGYRSNRVQVERLLNTIEEMVKVREEECYTNTLLQLVQRHVEKEIEVVKAESNGKWSEEQIRQKAMDRVCNKLFVKITGVTIGCLLGVLLGIVERIYYVQKMIEEGQEGLNSLAHLQIRNALVTGVVADGIKGGLTGYKAVEEEETLWGAIKKTTQITQVDAFKKAESIELRIVPLGKTGIGKSCTGNTILCAANVFEAKSSPVSVTQECKSETTTVNGRIIKYVDTPGIIDTLVSQEELKSKIWRSIIECAPGPHTYLIILKVERYTEQEQEVVRKIINTFGEKALKYAVVLFTHGDNLDENQTIEEFVSLSPQLQELVEKCEHRCHVIDNKYWKEQEDGYRSNRVQVERLLNTIEEMVKVNKGGCYTNKLLQLVQRHVEKEIEVVKAESNGKWSKDQIRQEAMNRVYTKLIKNLAVKAGILLGALLGIKHFMEYVMKAICD